MLSSCPVGPGLISSGPQQRILWSFGLSILRKRRGEGEFSGPNKGGDLFADLTWGQQLIPEKPQHTHVDLVQTQWLWPLPPSPSCPLWLCPQSYPAQGPDSWTQPSFSRLWSSFGGLVPAGSSLAAWSHESWRPVGGWEAWWGRSRQGRWGVLFLDCQVSRGREDEPQVGVLGMWCGFVGASRENYLGEAAAGFLARSLSVCSPFQIFLCHCLFPSPQTSHPPLLRPVNHFPLWSLHLSPHFPFHAIFLFLGWSVRLCPPLPLPLPLLPRSCWLWLAHARSPRRRCCPASGHSGFFYVCGSQQRWWTSVESLWHSGLSWSLKIAERLKSKLEKANSVISVLSSIIK